MRSSTIFSYALASAAYLALGAGCDADPSTNSSRVHTPTDHNPGTVQPPGATERRAAESTQEGSEEKGDPSNVDDRGNFEDRELKAQMRRQLLTELGATVEPPSETSVVAGFDWSQPAVAGLLQTFEPATPFPLIDRATRQEPISTPQIATVSRTYVRRNPTSLELSLEVYVFQNTARAAWEHFAGTLLAQMGPVPRLLVGPTVLGFSLHGDAAFNVASKELAYEAFYRYANIYVHASLSFEQAVTDSGGFSLMDLVRGIDSHFNAQPRFESISASGLAPKFVFVSLDKTVVPLEPNNGGFGQVSARFEVFDPLGGHVRYVLDPSSGTWSFPDPSYLAFNEGLSIETWPMTIPPNVCGTTFPHEDQPGHFKEEFFVVNQRGLVGSAVVSYTLVVAPTPPEEREHPPDHNERHDHADHHDDAHGRDHTPDHPGPPDEPGKPDDDGTSPPDDKGKPDEGSGPPENAPPVDAPGDPPGKDNPGDDNDHQGNAPQPPASAAGQGAGNASDKKPDDPGPPATPPGDSGDTPAPGASGGGDNGNGGHGDGKGKK